MRDRRWCVLYFVLGMSILGSASPAAAQTFQLTINVIGSGTTNPAPGTHDFPADSLVEVTAFPQLLWVLDHWEGDASGADRIIDVLMDGDKTITAVYRELGQFTLTTAATADGSISPPSGLFYEGSEVFITATPNEGFAFDHWEGDLTGTEQFGASVIMDGDKSVSAFFVTADHTLTVSRIGEGVLDPAPGTYGIVSGRTITFSASVGFPTPFGWNFDHWEGDLFGNANPQSLLIDADKSVTGVFVFGSVEQYTLQTSVDGLGTVTPSGTSQFSEGTPVQLTATPAEGWLFDHWEGDLTGSENPAVLVMDGNKAVVAVFVAEPTLYTLTIEVQGAGAVDVPSGQHFEAGSEVLLTATPEPGWEFLEWQGPVISTENPISVTMDADYTVVAIFTQVFHNLSMQVSGGGLVDPPVGEHSIAALTEVLLTATDDSGWFFLRWEGDVTGTENPAMLLMDGGKSVTAVFTTAPVYTLTAAVTGQGTIAPAAGMHQYTQGTEVLVTAVAAAGWQFDHWEGDIASSENPASVIMNQDRTITAVFVPEPTRSLTISVSGAGQTNPVPGTSTHPAGASVQLSATPSEGWRFSRWEGGLNSTDNPLMLTLDEDVSVTAVFIPIANRSLTLAVSGQGDIVPAPGVHLYTEGAEVAITATAAVGWTFQNWTGDASGAVNPLIVAMDADKTITAVFVEQNQEGGTDGEGNTDTAHSADPDGDGKVSLGELSRIIQFFNSLGLHCQPGTEDGFAPGPGGQTCAPHASDYNPQDWIIILTELLRLIQFYNSDGYHPCESGEDGFCPGAA